MDEHTTTPKISLAEAGKLGGKSATEKRFAQRYAKLRRMHGYAINSKRADEKLRKF